MTIAEHYRLFAELEAHGISGISEDWALGVAEDPVVQALVGGLPPAKRQPNLVFVAARFRGAPLASYGSFRS